jgi:putative peptidoglycan binding protein
VAAGAPPLNDAGLHIEREGRASWTREQWLRAHVRRSIRRSAWVTSRWARKHGVPIRWLTVAELRRAGPTPSRPQGFCSHNDVRLAWGQTSHTDFGAGFPKDYYLGLVRWYAGWRRPLASGVRGSDVVAWKRRLRRLGYRGFTVAFPGYGGGIFKATRLFQSRKGLEATGVVDPDTWAAVGG